MAVVTRAAAETGCWLRACDCQSRFYTFADLDPNEYVCVTIKGLERMGAYFG